MRGFRHRRSLAIVAALLWLLGVEALPDLHLATHHHDHTHAADGSIVEDHHDDHEDEHHDEGPSQLAFDHLPHHHAATGIAHHATALHQPATPPLAPVARPSASTFVHAAPNQRVSIAEASRPVARGPPVA